MTFEEKLQEYARLIVKVGVNVQKGQDIVLRCPVESYPFGRLIVKEGYEAGAREVIIHWSDAVSRRIAYDHADVSVFENIPEWQAESMNKYAREGAAFISIAGGDPEVFKGVDSEKLKASAKASDQAYEVFYKRMSASEIPWNVAAVPSEKWAQKVFPGIPVEEAMEKLWENIFRSVRIGEGDAVQAWKEHDAFLSSMCKKLDEQQFSALHYVNSLGTDFTVGLVENHRWEGGSEGDSRGVDFIANMPTEEIFTMPDARRAEGKLVSALPLSYEGNMIHNFSFTFHEGKVVEFAAEEGLETLKRMLDSDEGSRRLGEVALVPYDSPISNMKTLFYNTLFDENASCHFALGRCYETTVEGGASMSEEELKAVGGNTSMIHVDFMVGTSDLSITGIKKDGTEVPVFVNGNWAL
ncbi:MAG: aminopeptidase [Clostridiales bacterium]|nr:aminopeptidase [Clostridiales bacterium]